MSAAAVANRAPDPLAQLSSVQVAQDFDSLTALPVELQTGIHGDDYEFGDLAAYSTPLLLEDAAAIVKLEQCIKQGTSLLATLYTHRSCSRAIPQMDSMNAAQQQEMYSTTFQVLDADMRCLSDLNLFKEDATTQVCSSLKQLGRPDKRLLTASPKHLMTVLATLDTLIRLDVMKNLRTSLVNDFSWYKRTTQHVTGGDELAEALNQLHFFLIDRWSILHNLQTEVDRVTTCEEAIAILLGFCMEMLETGRALLYQQRHMLLRCLPLLLVLLLPRERDAEQVIKTRKLKLEKYLRVVRKNPAIAVYADMHMAPATLLPLSPFFVKLQKEGKLDAAAVSEMNDSALAECARNYELLPHMLNLSQAHDDFVARFGAVSARAEAAQSSGQDVSVEDATTVFAVVLEGIGLLNDWSGRVIEQCAWKYARPAATTAEGTGSTEYTVPANATIYERVIRYNYQPAEKKALTEVIGFIKGVSALMLRSSTFLQPILQQAVHQEEQQFLQNTLANMIRSIGKKKKREIHCMLLSMRASSADWLQKAEPPELTKKAKSGDPYSFNARACAPTQAQLQCIQHLLSELLAGAANQKTGFFEIKEFSTNKLRKLEDFYHMSFFFEPVLDYQAIVQASSDLSNLWYREFYLDIENTIQFPIHMSLPWLLIDHVITSGDPSLVEHTLLLFDIYNDASDRALTDLQQRFLYDEVEAEVDLCFEQLIFKLSEHMFTHAKMHAAHAQLDDEFRGQVESVVKLSLAPKRYAALIHQRFDLLGRSIDMSSLLTHRLNRLFCNNVEYIIERFEAGSLTSVLELQSLLRALHAAHKQLLQDLPLDSWDALMSETRDPLSEVMADAAGRLATQVVQELCSDILPNFIYNATTQRFVPGVRQPVDLSHRPAPPQLPKPSFLYGSRSLNAVFHRWAELQSQHFGASHLEACISLIKDGNLTWLCQELLTHLDNQLQYFVPYASELMTGMPQNVFLPLYDYGVVGCIGYFQAQLQHLLEYPALYTEVMQCLREMGNLLALFALLDSVARTEELSTFIQNASLFGISCTEDGIRRTGGEPLQSLAASSYSTVHNTAGNLSSTVASAGSVYEAAAQSSSLLCAVLHHTHKQLAAVRTTWAPPASLSQITDTYGSRAFHRLWSALQFVYCSGPAAGSPTNQDWFGDGFQWFGCVAMHLLDQQGMFELFDFSYHVLRVEEATRNTVPLDEATQAFLQTARQVQRQNTQVFGMLRAHWPHPAKPASIVDVNGAISQLPLMYPEVTGQL
eukprot:jgi/Chlat1/4696/Chrsp3S05625